MLKEIVLQELEELTGTYGGTTTNRMFTEIAIGDNSIAMEAAAPNTKAITAQLQRIGKGGRIGIIRIGGTFKLRRCKQ